MPRIPARRVLVPLALAAALAAPPALAGLDIDFGAAVRVGDRTDLFLAISSRYFDRDRPVVDRCAARYPNPDDVAVALFISRRSGRPLEQVDSLRRQGLTWWEISVRLGIPGGAWFVEVPRDPGPPYGKAYGHWKRHKHDHRHALALSDADARHLVAVRVLHEYYGVSVETAMSWRSSGRPLPELLSEEYQRRHGNKLARRDPPGKPDKGPHGKGHKP